jgi:hypothetical protein
VADAHGAALLPEGFVKLLSDSNSFFWYRDILHRSVVDVVREKRPQYAHDLISLLVELGVAPSSNALNKLYGALGARIAVINAEGTTFQRIVYGGDKRGTSCSPILGPAVSSLQRGKHERKRRVQPVGSAAQQRIDELEALIRAEHSRRHELEARLAELQRLSLSEMY